MQRQLPGSHRMLSFSSKPTCPTCSRQSLKRGRHTTAFGCSNINALGQPLSKEELSSLALFSAPQSSLPSRRRLTCPPSVIHETLAAGSSEQQSAGRLQLEAALLVAEQAHLECMDVSPLATEEGSAAGAAAGAPPPPPQAAAGGGAQSAPPPLPPPPAAAAKEEQDGGGGGATGGGLPSLDLQALQTAQMLQPVYATSRFFMRRFYVPRLLVEYFDLSHTRDGTTGHLKVVTLVGPLVLRFEGTGTWTTPNRLDYSVSTATACIGGLRLPFSYRLSNSFVFFAASRRLACSRGLLGGAVLWLVDPPGSHQYLSDIQQQA